MNVVVGIAATAESASEPDRRPPSASSLWVGVAGLAAGSLSIYLLRDWLAPSWLRTLVVVCASAGGMVLADILTRKTPRGSDLPIGALRPPDPIRVCKKLLGFWLTIGVIVAAYAVLSEYSQALYAPFVSAAPWCLPIVAIVSPLYISYVDRRQSNPNDAYAQLVDLVVGRAPQDWSDLRLHALGWVVKAFFLPLMFVYAHDALVLIWAREAPPSPASLQQVFAFTIDLLYLFDVLLAVGAYTLTLQLLGSSIRSVEPTLGGWVVCLICYQPFVQGVGGAYLNFDQDGLYWADALAGFPLLSFVWGLLILALVGVYVMSTAAFGLRFSNLTNRGIITSGPYRWLKHPAYVSKNLSWWLISVPFVAGAGWTVALKSSILLLGVNLIYFLRAKTEERHLRADPTYRQYEAYITEHGLVAKVARAFGRPPAPGRVQSPQHLARLSLTRFESLRPERGPHSPPRNMIRLWLAVAACAVAFLYLANLFTASLLLDGVRWFWLDDDQMISMRYARNLVDGLGLVWNPGERVEGYTNFGWVMIMAAVHLLPLPDQLMSVAMRLVSAAICFGVILLSARLLEKLCPRGLPYTLPVLLILILSCTDVMFWAVSGFETILVTALHLTVVLLALGGCRLDARLLIPLALIPIVRSDGMHIWLGDAALILLLAKDRRQAILLLLASLAPFALHLAFRVAYYGELLPNTYYLKVGDLDGRWSRGFRYVWDFVGRYSVVLILATAAVASLWRRDIRTRSFVTSLAPPIFYAAYVGGDFIGPFRMFAHVMPEIFLWAAIGAIVLMRAPVARAAWLAVPLVAVALPRLSSPLEQIVPMSWNGDPYESVIAAAELRKNASPDATVAVIAAGIVPYFTRLRSIDLLGKSDAHIARLRPQEGALVGHGKIDPAYSLGKQPDYLVSLRADAFVQNLQPLPREGTTDYVAAILMSDAFRSEWMGNPVPDPYLLEHNATYVRSGSPEAVKLAAWRGVAVAP